MKMSKETILFFDYIIQTNFFEDFQITQPKSKIHTIIDTKIYAGLYTIII